MICSIYKAGGTTLPENEMKTAIRIARERAAEVKNLIENAASEK